MGVGPTSSAWKADIINRYTTPAWSGMADSNCRPPAPKAGALAN